MDRKSPACLRLQVQLGSQHRSRLMSGSGEQGTQSGGKSTALSTDGELSSSDWPGDSCPGKQESQHPLHMPAA